jgi:hypothetical protein
MNGVFGQSRLSRKIGERNLPALGCDDAVHFRQGSFEGMHGITVIKLQLVSFNPRV